MEDYADRKDSIDRVQRMLYRFAYITAGIGIGSLLVTIAAQKSAWTYLTLICLALLVTLLLIVWAISTLEPE